jgi:transposase
VSSLTETIPDDFETLKAAFLAERAARCEAEARASGAEAMVAHLKLLIAKLKRERFGPSSEHRRRLLDQLELQLEELEASASEDACAVAAAMKAGRDERAVPGIARRKPVRAPLPAHLPRERVVIPAPSVCPCCQGKLVKLGEDVTETLEVIPRQWKVIQTVREKFTCRSCEKIAQPPAPFHPIARGRAGAGLTGDGPLRQVRQSPAAQPAERGLRPRGQPIEIAAHSDLSNFSYKHPPPPNPASAWGKVLAAKFG